MSEPFLILHSVPKLRLEVAWRDCLRRGQLSSDYNAPEFFTEPAPADRRSTRTRSREIPSYARINSRCCRRVLFPIK
jgi:hypothetical protein